MRQRRVIPRSNNNPNSAMKRTLLLLQLIVLVASCNAASPLPVAKRGLKGARSESAITSENHRELNVLKRWRKKMADFRLKFGDLKENRPLLADALFGSDVPSLTPSGAPLSTPSGSLLSAPSTAPLTAPSDAPSSAPTDVPINTPSRVPSSIPIDSPSLMPSIVPTRLITMKPTVMPSSVPSSLPSHTPNRLPSSSPSDMPSLAPSDTPSLIPSDAPSTMPSDSPSMAPVAWGASLDSSNTESFKEDSEFCSADASAPVGGAADVTVLYAYKLELVPDARLLEVTRKIEELLQAFLVESICNSDLKVIGVSPRPLDLPGAICGPRTDLVGDGSCFIIAGRTQLLLNEQLLEDSSPVYCQTLEQIRLFFASGEVPRLLSDEVAAVNSTVVGNLVPAICTVVERVNSLTADGENVTDSIFPDDVDGEDTPVESVPEGKWTDLLAGKAPTTKNDVSKPSAAPVDKSKNEDDQAISQSKGTVKSPTAPTKGGKKVSQPTSAPVDKAKKSGDEPKKDEPDKENKDKEPKADEGDEDVPKSEKEVPEDDVAAVVDDRSVNNSQSMASAATPSHTMAPGGIAGFCIAAVVVLALVGLVVYQRASRTSRAAVADLLRMNSSQSTRQSNISPRANSDGDDNDGDFIFSTSTLSDMGVLSSPRLEKYQRHSMMSP